MFFNNILIGVLGSALKQVFPDPNNSFAIFQAVEGIFVHIAHHYKIVVLI